MKRLTDEEYNILQSLAKENNITLQGYQVQGKYIVLNNSKSNEISGKNFDELKKSIREA